MSCIYKLNTWDILGTYNVYPIQFFWIYSAKFFDIHSIFIVYSMQCLYTQYTWDILCIYNVYPIEIFCIYNLNLFDIHGICIVYVMHITSIYLLYDNNNLPGPCTLTHLVLAPGTQHQPAWTYGSWTFLTLLMYQGYQNRLHHERLARCPLSHEWAVLVAEKTSYIPRIFMVHTMVYPWYILVYTKFFI